MSDPTYKTLFKFFVQQGTTGCSWINHPTQTDGRNGGYQCKCRIKSLFTNREPVLCGTAAAFWGKEDQLHLNVKAV